MSTIGVWQWAEKEPERLALVSAEGKEYTFKELAERTNQVARGLQSLGLKRGDGVAMVMPNDTAWVELFLATYQLGLYVTAINYHLAGPEIAYIVQNSEANVFVAHERFGQAAIEAAKELNYNPQHMFSVGATEGFRSYSELFEGQSAALPEDRSPGQLMLYTSGTTGRPKGVRRPLFGGTPESAGQMYLLMSQMFRIKPGDGIHLTTGPLYHAAPGGISMAALQTGQTLVLMDKWTPDGMLEVIERYRVTSMHMVPIMFQRLLHLPDDVKQRYDLSSLETVIHGAAPCPRETKQKIIEWFGPVIYEYYGATEGGGTIIDSKEWLEHPGSVGKPWPGSTIKILDDDGNELATKEQGSVFMSSMIGEFEYFKDKDKTEGSRKGKLFTVGDIGYFDEDNYLYLCDRKADLVISGGVNIYPAEVEAALSQHPSVGDVAVFGIPDEEWGESLKAVVELKSGIEDNDALCEELLEFAGKKIARFKLPKSIDFTDALPRLPTGKLYKRLLRDPYWENSERRI